MINEKLKDVIKFGLLILTTSIVENKAPDAVIVVFYLLILYFFSRSKKNYFWIVYLITIYNRTGGIFDNYHDIFKIGLFTFSLVEAFSLVALHKIIRDKIKGDIFYRKLFLIFLAYCGFLLVLGFFYGMLHGRSGFGLLYAILRNVILITLFFSIPRLITQGNSLYKMANLLFTGVFINILGQIFTLIYKTPLLSILNIQTKTYLSELIRPLYGYYIIFLAMFLAMYFFIKGSKFFSKIYLSVIIFLSCFSIFISATRGWIVAILFILIFWIILNLRSLKALPVIFLVFLFGYYFITKYSPMIEKQFEYSADRFSTMRDLSEGDLTARGTLRRLTTRHESAIKKFYEKPILGWGYSSEGYDTHDYHVGNQSILMIGGIVGMIIIIYMLFFIIKQPLYLYFNIRKNGFRKQQLLLIPIFTFGLFIIHSSSTQLFGFMPYLYPLHFNKVIFLSIIFSFFNFIYINQYKNLLILKEKISVRKS